MQYNFSRIRPPPTRAESAERAPFAIQMITIHSF